MFKKFGKISMEDMEKIFNEVLNSDSIMNIKNMGEEYWFLCKRNC